MGPKSCPETSVRNYYKTLCNSSEEHDSQDRQCTYKIKTRRVKVTDVAVKNNITYSQCDSVASFSNTLSTCALLY